MLDTLHQNTIQRVFELEALGLYEDAHDHMQSFLNLRDTVLEVEAKLDQLERDALELKSTAELMQQTVSQALEAAGFTCVNGDWMTADQLKEWAAAEHVYGEFQHDLLDEYGKGGES